MFFMKKNVGNVDSAIRICLAITIVVLYYFGVIIAPWAYVLLGFAVILLVTSVARRCLIYPLLGINTRTAKTNPETAR